MSSGRGFTLRQKRVPKPGAQGLLSELGICLAAAQRELAMHAPLANAARLVISRLAAVWQFGPPGNPEP